MMEEWCVCSTRSGDLSLMTRQQREFILNLLKKLNLGTPSFVVKVFDNKEDAEEYIKNQREINDLLDETLRK